jgi:hypothetical protein
MPRRIRPQDKAQARSLSFEVGAKEPQVPRSLLWQHTPQGSQGEHVGGGEVGGWDGVPGEPGGVKTATAQVKSQCSVSIIETEFKESGDSQSATTRTSSSTDGSGPKNLFPSDSESRPTIGSISLEPGTISRPPRSSLPCPEMLISPPSSSERGLQVPSPKSIQGPTVLLPGKKLSSGSEKPG